MAVSNIIDRVSNMRVLDMPVGKAALILASIGVGKGLTDVVASRWPQQAKWAGLIAGGGLAYAVRKIGAIRNFLGDTGSEALAIGGMCAAILSFYDIQGRIEGFIAQKLAKPAPAPTPTPTPTPEMMAGAGEFGQVPRYKSDVERRLEAIRQAQRARV